MTVIRKIFLFIAVLVCFATIPVSAQAGTWTQQFTESFNTNASLGNFGSVYSTKFDNYDGYTDTSGHGTYSNANTLSVHDGVLDIWLHSSQVSGVWKHWVSAALPKWPCASGTPGRWVDSNGNGVCHSITYGAVGIVFSVDDATPLTRYKTAWLTWPDSNSWPGDGEIDLMESCSDLTGNMCVATHPAQSDPNAVAITNTNVKYTDNYVGHPTWGSYHEIWMQWYPDRVVYTLDGNVVATHYGEPGYPVPSNPMHFVLQNETQTGGASAPSNSTSGHIYVDSVEVWDYNP